MEKYSTKQNEKENKENLKARYQIILNQRDNAYNQLEKAKATVKYMDDKVKHYEKILAGIIPDDSNPKNWTEKTKPNNH